MSTRAEFARRRHPRVAALAAGIVLCAVVGAAASDAAVAAAPSHPFVRGGATSPVAALPLGPYRYVERGYDLGRADLSVIGDDGRAHALPTRLVGEITAPIGATGRLPVAVFLHGAHQSCIEGPYGMVSSDYPCPPGWQPVPSYEGYRYVARDLASQGWIVISVDGRPVAPFDHTDRPFPDGAAAGVGTWMDLRARIVDAHLRRLVAAGDGATGPDFEFAGVALAGRIDATRVGLVGHSRGGEGVVWAALLPGPRPYRIGAILALAPVDFARRTLPADTPFAVVLPTCDGDVSDLQGADFYDDARNLHRTAPLLQIAVHGGNHDFFNSVWPDEYGPAIGAGGPAVGRMDPGAGGVGQPGSPGPSGGPDASPDASPMPNLSPLPTPTSAPGNGGDSGSYCASSAIGKTRLTRPTEEKVGATIVVDFLRGTIEGKAALLHAIGADAAPPRTLAGIPVTVRFQAPTPDRLDLAPIDGSPYDLTQTVAGGRIHVERVVYYGLCTPGTPDANGGADPCPPHGFAQAQVAPELRVGWRRLGARIRFELATEPVDLRGFAAVSLSVAVSPHDADPELNTATAARPFSVVLVDVHGRQARAVVSSHENAVRQWPTLTVLGTIRLPLATYRGIDLGAVTAVEIVFDRTPRGAVLISDVAIVR